MPKAQGQDDKGTKTPGIKKDATSKVPATKKKAAAKGTGDKSFDVNLPTAAEFLKSAKPLKITVNSEEFTAQPKEFSSGSYGWTLTGKVLKTTVGGKAVQAQIGLNMPVRGSKAQAEDDDGEDDQNPASSSDDDDEDYK